MTSVSVSGAVFAGGRSSRMGTDKARLVVDGETLLARQLRLLAEAGVDERLVSVAPGKGGEIPLDVRVVADREVGLGPLSGLASCLAAAVHPLILVLAVDLPHLTVPLLQHLLAQATPDQGVVPIHSGMSEPLVAVYPRLALPEITRRLGQRELALQPLIQAGIAGGWLRPLELTGAEAALLTNWNYPEDLPRA